MGILVNHLFSTDDGIDISGVYLTLRSFSVNMSSSSVFITSVFGVYISRTAYKSGRSGLQHNILNSTEHQTISYSKFMSVPILSFLYYKYANTLQGRGYTIENVLEEGQSPYTPDADDLASDTP